jgi:hypothetical protein
MVISPVNLVNNLTRAESTSLWTYFLHPGAVRTAWFTVPNAQPVCTGVLGISTGADRSRVTLFLLLLHPVANAVFAAIEGNGAVAKSGPVLNGRGSATCAAHPLAPSSKAGVHRSCKKINQRSGICDLLIK